MTTFHEFGLDEAIVTAVEKLGFESATPIQAATIPALLEGQDMIGRARTGSGKTAAFGLSCDTFAYSGFFFTCEGKATPQLPHFILYGSDLAPQSEQ